MVGRLRESLVASSVVKCKVTGCVLSATNSLLISLSPSKMVVLWLEMRWARVDGDMA